MFLRSFRGAAGSAAGVHRLARAAVRAAAWAFAAMLLHVPLAGAAGSVEQLRSFLRDTQTGRGDFTQIVTAADGQRRKTSGGTFAFARPDRFRFNYTQPFEQLIVADGQRVWIYDPDLNQASSRKLDAALDGTPAALLVGGRLEKDFVLSDDGVRDGLSWVLAKPRAAESTVRSLRVGFRGALPAVIEVLDAFGQRSQLQFVRFEPSAVLDAGLFRFQPPPGADVLEQ
jgi:outer membrane lipoprotein carrier protein